MKTLNKNFGFDLDNTLIDYSEAVKEYCKIKSVDTCSNIRILREKLGKNGSSDHEWQLAQGWLYTEGLRYAQPGFGSTALCNYLTQKGYHLYIVSHKTSYTPDFCGRIPLHDLATNWIKKSAIANYFKKTDQIYYELTRELKIKRIRELSLNYFVDDLEEIFAEPEFPINTQGFLINKNKSQNSKVKCVANFKNIQEIIADDF